MAVELYDKVEFKIKTQEKTSVYPIMVKLELAPDDEQEFEAFKTELEKEFKDIHEAAQNATELRKQIGRLREDIEDIEDEIEDLTDEDDHKKRKRLKKHRREIRKELRLLEDELSSIEKEYDISAYTKMKDDLVESIAKESFRINVIDNEEKKALEKAIAEYGIKYSIVVAELGRLIGEAKRKKKRRS